jgi:hypothetical protein
MYKWSEGNKTSNLKVKSTFRKIKLRDVCIGLAIISNLGLKTLSNEEINKSKYITTDTTHIEKPIVEIIIEKKEIKEPIYPQEFMRKMGMNLCASYAKLIAQSMGHELNNVIYMNAWEMAYNLHKDGWKYEDSNKILNLIMLKANLENKYYNSSLKRIEKTKDEIDYFNYLEIKDDIIRKEFNQAKEKIENIIFEKFNELPDGTMLFTINRNSNFRKKANQYKMGAPTHVLIKSNDMWRDYDVYNERIRSSEEMLKTTKMITHIVTPPKINSVQSVDIEIPEKIINLKGKKKVNKAIEYSQYKDIGMWQYLSYRIYKSEENEITIKKNEKTISVQGKSSSQGNL